MTNAFSRMFSTARLAQHRIATAVSAVPREQFRKSNVNATIFHLSRFGTKNFSSAATAAARTPQTPSSTSSTKTSSESSPSSAVKGVDTHGRVNPPKPPPYQQGPHINLLEPKKSVAVIGAGVIGLAITRTLALSDKFETIYLLESAGEFGTKTSSRNSEVIHAGVYYPHNSWKHRLCIAGKKSLVYFY